MPAQTIYVLTCEDAVAFICESEWGFAEIDPNGKFSWMNQAYCRALNAPLELILATEHNAWVHSEDVEINTELAGRVKTGEIPGYTLSMRYIQRGSTPQRQLVIWGFLSVAGKWTDTNFAGYRVQFRQYDPDPYQHQKWNIKLLTSKALVAGKWGVTNWKSILTIAFVVMSLTLGGSSKLLETLRRASEVKQSVDSALDSLSSGASSQPPLPSPPGSP